MTREQQHSRGRAQRRFRLNSIVLDNVAAIFMSLAGTGLVLALSAGQVSAAPIPAQDHLVQVEAEVDIAINDPFFPGGFAETLMMKTANGMPAEWHYDAQIGDTIATEIVSMDLFGNSPKRRGQFSHCCIDHALARLKKRKGARLNFCRPYETEPGISSFFLPA